jgi:signal transduction histidine kinase
MDEIGGQLVIESAPGQGTSVYACLPDKIEPQEVELTHE